MPNLIYPIKVKKSTIAGKGAFAITKIPARSKIGNMTGELIPFKEARKRVRNQPHNVLFMVEFDNRKVALDASVHFNELRYINHSCEPNTYMRRAFNRVEYYALRQIESGEELSCDYGETHHNGTLPCRCGSSKCRKRI